ncbi:hypothetical protein [Deinococcus apachensis]|uniref:hypothetical protein n=1 Tax=Deinococcus apachensis TaxID=309886 RepID=UPI00036696E6|nr:hypothetical protein [Deinococcus apachensis]
MPDRDDKNSGHTSQPGEYKRDGQEVHEREKDDRPSFKGANDREAEAARNTEHDCRKESGDVEEARSVPASEQG